MSSFSKLMLALGVLLAAGTIGGAAPTKEAIAKKVQELGNDEFTIREAATKFLWEAGKLAEPALREALKSKDLEVARRAADILDKFKWGIYPNTPKNVTEFISRYKDGNPETRQAVFKELIQLGPPAFPTLFKIAGAEENVVARRNLLQQATHEASQAALKLLLERQSADHLLELCLVGEADISIRNYAAYALLRGQLEDKIKQFQAQVEKSDDPQAWEVLAYLYRAQGNLSKAKEAAARTGKKPLLKGILYEAADWKALAKLAGEKEDGANDAEPIEALGYRTAYHRLAGNTAEFDKAVAAVVKYAADKSDDDGDLWYSAKALLVNERLPEALTILGKSRNATPLFEVLVAQLRHREAFDLAEKKRDDGGEDPLSLEIRRARALYNLGEKDAGLQLLDKLAEKLKAKGEPGQFEQLVEALTRLGLTEKAFEQAAWMLPKIEGDATQRRLLGHLFPKKDSGIEIWWSFLRRRKASDEPAVLLKKLRDLYAGKVPGKEIEELVKELELAALDVPPAERVSWLRAVGEISLTNKLDALAESSFQKAAQQSGLASAWVRLGDYWAEKKSWKEALEAYTQAWEKDRSQPVPLYLRGWALLQTGREDEGRRLMELAHLLPLGNEHARHDLAEALSQHGLKEAAQKERDTILRTAEFESWYLDDALRHVAHELVVKNDYLRAADLYDRFMLRCLHTSRAFVDNSAYLIVIHMIHRYRARGLIAAGRLDEARSEIQRCLAALPGEVELAIQLVPELEKRGRKQEADELFARTLATWEKVCADYPNSAVNHNTWAWLAACCRRELDKAQEHARKAVELVPNHAGHLDTLAEVLFQRGDRAQAIEHMKKCIELEPKNQYFRKQLQRMEAGDPKVNVPDPTN